LLSSDLEALSGHDIEKKELGKKWESENYSEGWKEPSIVMKWKREVFCAASIVRK
jgi:hypothetical protein